MADFAHSNDRRKQRCHFCGERLKNYRDIEVQNGTGYKFHLWCKQTIDSLKKQQRKPQITDVYLAQNFIECIYEKSKKLLVYQ